MTALCLRGAHRFACSRIVGGGWWQCGSVRMPRFVLWPRASDLLCLFEFIHSTRALVVILTQSPT